MKQSLQLRLGQQITMTPQLQQAIRLLQLSTLDLQLEIQQALESNIMLEVAEEEEFELNDEVKEQLNSEEYEANQDFEDAPSTPEVGEQFEAQTDIPTELAVDSAWEDIYENTYSHQDLNNSNNNPDVNGKELALQQGSAPETLQNYLVWQLDLTPFSEIDRIIALAIIDSIDEDGYLKTPTPNTCVLQEICDSINEAIGLEEQTYIEEEISIEEVQTVLRRVQHFDPVGIGARDLKECLLLQLNALNQDVPLRTEALRVVGEYLDLLGTHDYNQLLRKTKLERTVLQQVIDLIQSLEPRPGRKIESHRPNYIIPDVFVKKVKDEWKVDLNPDIAPKLRVNEQYAGLITRADKSEETSNLKNHLQEARWFIKSLRSRHDTLLKVARCIVQRQAGFLEYGEEAMRPLILHDIATELDMHESTISRVTTQKYIHTPRGIFELKYFFSSHVGTESGGECSSTAIRALIKKLIAAENAAKPLSDNKIAKILSERGIKVARRTVAKYREAMVIPPSNERKRLA
ncbi:RNA polymerase factor sigma-54 [Candidatus Albibeggiatoa sp. nov. BB20]|uniref:RNA polymerase factor sigma-54 n=1 Tax=Candidatus Albibeggiatoa sp. nov. BB20 TaxID=3162723 RepID=UPI00336533F4